MSLRFSYKLRLFSISPLFNFSIFKGLSRRFLTSYMREFAVFFFYKCCNVIYRFSLQMIPQSEIKTMREEKSFSEVKFNEFIKRYKILQVICWLLVAKLCSKGGKLDIITEKHSFLLHHHITSNDFCFSCVNLSR